MSNSTTYIETRGTETHEVEVLSHRTFRATFFGPVLAEVIVTRATIVEDAQGDRAGVVCFPAFSVRVDGEHLFGGVAGHMGADGLPKMSPVLFGTEVLDEEPEEPEEPVYAPAEESAIVKLALAMGEYVQHRDARNNAGKARESKAEQVAQAKVDGMAAIIADCMGLAATPFAARSAIAYAWGYGEVTYDLIARQGNRESAFFLRSCWVAEVLDRFAHDTGRI